MEVLQSLYLTQTIHTISGVMMVPVAVILLLLVAYAIYTVGGLLVEVFVERKRYSARIPELVAQLEESQPSQLSCVIDESGLLLSQRNDLQELLRYLYLPVDGRTEVAKRLLANERAAWKKTIDKTDVASKAAPMIGLMGTLIPLGPGLVALGAGNVETLSSSMQFAFDTTVAGLAVAVVCMIATRVRRAWYSDYLVSMEAAFNALLEKGQILHDQGYRFERAASRGATDGCEMRADAPAAAAFDGESAPSPSAGRER